MFDTPLDTWYVYAGVAAVSCAAFGVVVGFPTATPPDAATAAAAVDRIATAPHVARANHPLQADAIRLRRGGLALRGPGGTARATFAYGPVTPVRGHSQLRRVLDGEPPGDVFETVAAFRQAITAAQERAPRWQPAGAHLVVRTLTWKGIDVTLVGA